MKAPSFTQSVVIPIPQLGLKNKFNLIHKPQVYRSSFSILLASDLMSLGRRIHRLGGHNQMPNY